MTVLRWIGGLPARIAATIVRIFWGLLSLDGDQQRALMTWGLLGAMVAVSFGIMHGVDVLQAWFAIASETIRQMIVSILGDGLKLAIALLTLFGGGLVLIARGGEVTVKTPGGIEISARGPAATRELAKSADLAKLTEGTNNEPA